MAKAKNYKLVQVNMLDDTLKKVDELKERLHVVNKTTAIRASIDIADMVTDTISKGGKIILEEPDGNKYVMKLPGITRHA